MPTVSTKVYGRNDIGQFIRECEMAATRTVEDLVKKGAERSRALAPVGPKPDGRTIPLKASIYTEMTGRTSGRWGSSARHAAPVEFGAGPHPIPGNPALSFFWEAEGRQWIPAEKYYGVPGLADVVNHPGNPSQPFLRPAYHEIVGSVSSVGARYYPG